MLFLVITVTLSLFLILLERDTPANMALLYQRQERLMRLLFSEWDSDDIANISIRIDSNKNQQIKEKVSFTVAPKLGNSIHGNNNRLLILGWNFGSRFLVGSLFQPGYDVVTSCSSCFTHSSQTADCVFTGNTSLVNEAHAVVFHASYMSENSMPPERWEGQKWIFFTRESPFHHIRADINLKHFEGMFNLTMTYSLESSVLASYGECVRVRRGTHSETPNAKSIWNGKFKMAAWFVSHCKTESKREAYVKQLKQYILVDVYGKCGNLQCPYRAGECYQLVENNYFFYLSFENSLCKDYITEKLYYLLINSINVIPVVYGGANYKILLPPNSFLSAADYKSPKELSGYMTYLSQNATAYGEYFNWRSQYTCQEPFWPSLLCNYLHAYGREKTSVRDLSHFWSPSSQCVQL